MKIKSMTQQ